MLTSTDLLIPRRLKSRLTESIPIDRFVVFGSRARGDAGSDADMDVYIEVQSLNPNLRRQISEIAWEVSLDSGVLSQLWWRVDLIRWQVTPFGKRLTRRE
jgi:predicted nucleotidyltransferase